MTDALTGLLGAAAAVLLLGCTIMTHWLRQQRAEISKKRAELWANQQMNKALQAHLAEVREEQKSQARAQLARDLADGPTPSQVQDLLHDADDTFDGI